MSVKLVSDSTALLSMRESDFDAYSAFGEIIDNSIQAESTNIKIKIISSSHGKKKTGYDYINSIAFGDDGIGMDPEVLHRCLQLGYSSRFNDRKGIGRFGVGMTLAAINQCQRVEIYSKQKNGEFLWTYIDLEHITCDPPKMETIPKPKPKQVPNEFEKLVGKKSGTLVVWSKYDRQPCSASEMIEEMHIWIGRTYRHFLWDSLNVFVDNNPVYTIDPLYRNWEKSKFPEDTPSEEFAPIKMTWPVTPQLQDVAGTDESEITIRMSLVHESLRPSQGWGKSKPAVARSLDRNQGVSILRNGREVFYGHIPYWPGRSDWFNEKDRYWGCEISFNAVLDRAFTVKNVKRGAVPNRELKKAIFERINPTRNTCLEKIDVVWAQKKSDDDKSNQEKVGVITGHEEAENIAKKTATDKSVIDKDKDLDKEAERLSEDTKKHISAEERAKWEALWKSQPFTIDEDNWKGPEFIEAIHLGGKDVIKYNLTHPFFVQLKCITDELREGVNEKDNAQKLQILIDLLLISYSKTEAKFEKDDSYTAEQFVELLRMNWGMYLQNYLKTWLRELEG